MEQSSHINWDALPYGGDLYGEMHLAESAPAPAGVAKVPIFPGLAACGVASAAAAWLSEHYHFPIILLGLLAKHLPFKQETWEKVIRSSVPEKYLEMNLKAFGIL